VDVVDRRYEVSIRDLSLDPEQDVAAGLLPLSLGEAEAEPGALFTVIESGPNDSGALPAYLRGQLRGRAHRHPPDGVRTEISAPGALPGSTTAGLPPPGDDETPPACAQPVSTLQ